MTKERPALRDLLDAHQPRQWSDLAAGQWHVVQWMPPMKIGDMFRADWSVPEVTTVYRATFRAEYVGGAGRRYAILGRWEDVGSWQEVGTIA